MKNLANCSKLKVLSKNETKKLEKMFQLQKKFASRFFVMEDMTQEQKVSLTKEYLHCIYNECEEIKNWIPWKHWKKPYVVTKKIEKEIKMEIIDVWHFLMDLALVWGMTPQEFFDFYMAKQNENINRQKKGY